MVSTKPGSMWPECWLPICVGRGREGRGVRVMERGGGRVWVMGRARVWVIESGGRGGGYGEEKNQREKERTEDEQQGGWDE